MNSFLFILLLSPWARSLYVLVRGVIAMANGKDVTGEVQQSYMQKRVLYQGDRGRHRRADPRNGRRPRLSSGQAQQNLHPHRRWRLGGLVDGSRVSKSSARMAAIGEVDEANSAIGVGHRRAYARQAQQQAFAPSKTNCSTSVPTSRPRANRRRAANRRSAGDRLEEEIDAMNASLSPLTSFILPGGSMAVSLLHLARAVVRRAERAAVALQEAELSIHTPWLI